MRRASLAFVGAVSLLANSTNLRADLPSPLELARGLRSNNQVELALQYLNELKAKPGKLSAEDAKILPLEFARAILEQASEEAEDGKRTSLLNQARAEFESFIKANPDHPMASQANVEIARLLSLNAKGIYSKSRRAESAEAKRLEASKARRPFNDAFARYTQAIKGISDRMNTIDTKSPVFAELKRSKEQAELDQVVIMYDIGLTFDLDADRRERNDQFDKARKAFEALAGKYEKTRVGYVAMIWAWECQYENGEQKRAAESIEAFINTNGNNREAGEAVRLGRYFGIQHTFEKGSFDTSVKETPVQQAARTEAAAARWLQTYPESRNTPEGIGARYRLALMKERQAKVPANITYDEKTEKVKSISGIARQKLTEANRIYKDISESDNEYTDRAIRSRLRNLIILLEADGGAEDKNPKLINTLEEGFLAAQVQQGRINMMRERLANPPKAKAPEPKPEPMKKDAKVDPKKEVAPVVLTPEMVEKEEVRRTNLMVQYLERALMMATPKDSVRDIFDAQLMLCNVLSKVNRANEAAILGEAMARNNPKMGKASVAALLGVYAYNTGIGKLKERGGDDKAYAADVNRLKNLASFASTTWPSESATDAIRHVHAFYLNKEKNLSGAWDVYNKIGNGYSEIFHARRDQAVVLFTLIKPEERDPKKYAEAVKKNIADNTSRWKATIDALEQLPEPTPGTEVDDAEAYIGARTQLAQLYLMAGDVAKVEATTKALVTLIPKLAKLNPQKGIDLTCVARSLAYAAVASKAEEARRAKDFAQVAQLLDPQVANMKKELETPTTETTSGFQVMRRRQRDLLTVAMTASVQDKKIERANELLELLQKSGGDIEQSIANMRSLVTSIKNQIDQLKAENNQTESQALSASFTEFLDKLGGENAAKASNALITFLGQGYAAVDQFKKAAALYESVLAREFTAPPKKNEEEIKELQEKENVFKRNVKFLLAQAQRQAGDAESFKKAMATMQEIIGGDPLKGVAKEKRGWGYSSIPIRKEYCQLLEDQKIWGAAVQNWTRLTKEFVGDLPALPKQGDKDAQKKSGQRQLYFDLFYENYRCSLKAYAAQDPMKFKGGLAAIDDKMNDVAMKLAEVVGRNSDISTETVDKIKKLTETYPKIKKKFEDTLASFANAKSEEKTEPKQ